MTLFEGLKRSNLFWGNMPHLVLVSIKPAASTLLQGNFHTLIQGREH